MKSRDAKSRALWRGCVVLALAVALVLTMTQIAFAIADEFGGASFTAPYAPYTAGPVVNEDVEPYAPYEAGPVIHASDLK